MALVLQRRFLTSRRINLNIQVVVSHLKISFDSFHSVTCQCCHEKAGQTFSDTKDTSNSDAAKRMQNNFDKILKKRRSFEFGSKSAVSPVHRLNKILPPEYRVENLEQTDRVSDVDSEKSETDDSFKNLHSHGDDEIRQKFPSKDESELSPVQFDNMGSQQKPSRSRHKTSPMERLKSLLPKDE